MATQAMTTKDKVMSLVAFLQSKKESIDNVAQRAVKGDDLIKLLQVACSRNSKLADCTGLSLLSALICCAEFGLRLGPAGHFYIIPFWNGILKKNEAVPVVGYRGMIELVTRDNDVAGVEARLVREGDKFDLQYGTDARITHRPSMKNRGGIVGAYCVTTMPNGHKQFEFMSLEELLKIKARSPMGKKNKGPWKLTANGDDNDFGEMCRKSVTRRGLKYVPIGIDAANLLARADEMDGGDIQSITLNVEGANEGLAERLEASQAADAKRREEENPDDGQQEEGTGDEPPEEKAGPAPEDGRDDAGFEESQHDARTLTPAEQSLRDGEAPEEPAQSLLDRLDAT